MPYDSKTNIFTTLRNAADETDLIVGMGSSWVHELRADAARSDAPSSILSDWKTIEAWLGCAGRELNQDDHAKIGDACLSYFAKGISPSAGSESAFRNFAQRIKHQNRVHVSVPPQIEKVFDRMLASDEEIQARQPELQRAKTQTDSCPMTHHEYVVLRKKGGIVAGIDYSSAMKLIDVLPKRYQAATHFWSFIWILSIPFFIVAAFFTMGIGLLGLIFITPSISRSVKKSAAEFVLEHAEEDENFFDMLVEKNLLTFKQFEPVRPDAIESLKSGREAADRGNVQALYERGWAEFLVNEEPPNYTQSYKWLTIAASRALDPASREHINKKRVIVAAEMTPTQIAEAERLALEWKPK